jgi:hypothetical protein
MKQPISKTILHSYPTTGKNSTRQPNSSSAVTSHFYNFNSRIAMRANKYFTNI